MRRYLNILDEAKLYVGLMQPDHYADPVDIVILKNPSRAEFRGLLRRSQQQQLRGLWEGDTLLVWDAFLATHSEVVRFLREQDTPYDGSDLFFTETEIKYNNAPDEFDQEAIERLAMAVRHSPTVRRLYPNPDRIPMEIEKDNGTRYYV